ncbi:MAG: thermonuclease family protein [Candidatus Omnitrophota bacterium]
MQSNKVFILLAFVFLLIGCSSPAINTNLYSVSTVIDGDTVILSNGEHVRYIGIDTPETRKKVNGAWEYVPEPFAAEASDLNKNLVEGETVTLEFDKELRDKYGRLLAYVFIRDKMVNEELLLGGYAKLLIIAPNTKYADRLKKAQSAAQDLKKGIWSLK